VLLYDLIDLSCRVGATSEWKILYSLAKDKDGLLRKDVARGVYDGSLFHQLVQKKRTGDK
jgi:peroxygenase